MFIRNSAIVVGAVLATALAVIGGNMAERRVMTEEQWARAVARIPSREAGPPGPPPGVEEQPKVDTFEANPFAGRRFGKLVPDRERLEKIRVRSKLFENLSGLAFLLAKAIPLLAAFLLWQGWRNKQESNIGNAPVESVSHEQPQTDSRCSVPDGEAAAADGEGLPVRTGTPGSV